MSLLRRTEKKPDSPVPPVPRARDAYLDLKIRVESRLVAELDLWMDVSRIAEVRMTIRKMYEAILQEESIILGQKERDALFEHIVAEILGLGPLEPLLADDSITEIMCNGPRMIFVERKGRLNRVNLAFDSDEHLMQVINRIVAPLGLRIDQNSPYVNARLKDGSRVSAAVAPIALHGPVLVVRKFFKKSLTIEDIIRIGSLTEEATEFLRACIIARLNILISGETSSGKTTLLNILSGFLDPEERVITIENPAELYLRLAHVVTLETRPPYIDGQGGIDVKDLIENCVRMRPDRIILGNLSKGMYEPMLLATNLCDGVLFTLQADSPYDALSQIEHLALEEKPLLPTPLIRQQIAESIDLIVHLRHFHDGTRKVACISEVSYIEKARIILEDIFLFEQTGFEEGKIVGRLQPTGYKPQCLPRIGINGVQLPSTLFIRV